MSTTLENRNRLLRFSGGQIRDPAVEIWFERRTLELRPIAKLWFNVTRACGDDVRELLHDGHPTACLGDVAFGYVNAFTAHVNVGFFRGAELPDPAGILQGNGKFMRHIKLRPGEVFDEDALTDLINNAYEDIRNRTVIKLP